jgi:acetolactate synthase-1/2/3 large subunit
MSGLVRNDGAAVLARSLADAGARVVFGFPGETTLPLYAAFRSQRLRHVMARCERCAGYMADAYARLRNEVGVCDAPGGVGSPFLLPALHEAHNSSVALLAITSGTPARGIGRWTTSDCAHDRMFAPAVKETVSIGDVRRIVESTRYAMRVATGGRPGPVHLDVASDVLSAAAASDDAPHGAAPFCVAFPSSRPRPDRARLAAAAELVASAQRPLLVAGGGVLLSAASPALERFANAFRVPVATTFNGKGSLAETHPSAIGVIGAKGDLVANRLASEADVIVWTGSKAGDKSTNGGTLPVRGTAIVQIDADPAELGRIVDCRVGLVADAGAALDDLREALGALEWPGAAPAWSEATRSRVAEERARADAARDPVDGMSTPLAVRAVQQIFHQPVIVADASRASSFVGAYVRTSVSGRSVIAPRGSGSIGYALPATIGAAIACPDRAVVGIGGDAGFAMACHELETAVRLGLRFTFVVLDNNAPALLNQVAAVTLGENDLCGSFAPTDWAAVARGFGCAGYDIATLGDLRGALREARMSPRPSVLRLRVESSERSPDLDIFVQRRAAAALEQIAEVR